MSQYEMNFGQFLREKRKAKGMSIRQVAMYAGCSVSYLSQLERGERGLRGPSPRVLRKLALPLGVPYEVLMAAAGHHLLTEKDTIYSGVLVRVLRDCLGDGVKDFAARIGAFGDEIEAMEQHGVSLETLEGIYQKIYEKQRKLSSNQKALIQRMELAFCDLPKETSEKMEQSFYYILTLVETSTNFGQ